MGGLTDNNRNVAIYGRTIIDTSNDDYVDALDAVTGELAWETQIFDYQVHPARHSSGPVIANGKVVSGRSCRPRAGPVSCVIVAHDAATGDELWRTSLVPAPGEPGDETWGGVPYEERVHVGSWMVPSYDPDLDLIYVGTSVTSPAPKFMLGGVDNQHLYHNSTLALDGETGAIRWYYQHLNDHWDLDHPYERILVDTAVAPDADAVSWINPRLRPNEVRRVVTGIPGKSGKNWPAGAYSPLTNTMYFPLQNTCARLLSTMEGGLTIYRLAARLQLTPGTDDLGTVRAVSAETGETAWMHEQRAATYALVATGGGLVFGGDGNGRFRAFDQESGEVLWEINLGSPVSGFPITYAVGGRQYIVASTSTRISGLTPDLRPSAGNNLFVFALPERHRNP